jgi:hypothetical protein
VRRYVAEWPEPAGAAAAATASARAPAAAPESTSRCGERVEPIERALRLRELRLGVARLDAREPLAQLVAQLGVLVGGEEGWGARDRKRAGRAVR